MATAGLVRAAFRICQMRVTNEIPAVISRATAKSHQETGLMDEVFQIPVDSQPRDGRSNHEGNAQQQVIFAQEHLHDRPGGCPVHLADGYFAIPLLHVEQRQTEQSQRRDQDGYQRKDRIDHRQLPVFLVQCFVLVLDERIFKATAEQLLMQLFQEKQNLLLAPGCRYYQKR